MFFSFYHLLFDWNFFHPEKTNYLFNLRRSSKEAASCNGFKGEKKNGMVIL